MLFLKFINYWDWVKYAQNSLKWYLKCLQKFPKTSPTMPWNRHVLHHYSYSDCSTIDLQFIKKYLLDAGVFCRVAEKGDQLEYLALEQAFWGPLAAIPLKDWKILIEQSA